MRNILPDARPADNWPPMPNKIATSHERKKTHLVARDRVGPMGLRTNFDFKSARSMIEPAEHYRAECQPSTSAVAEIGWTAPVVIACVAPTGT
jgi:hypothetical protein